MFRTKSRFALAVTATVAVVIGLLNPMAAFAGNDGMLNTALTAQNTSVYSGDALVYEAQLSCSDPAACANITLHFSKPDAVKAGALAAVTAPYPPGVDSVVPNADGSIDVVYSSTDAGLVSQLAVSWPTENYTTSPGNQTTTMTVTQPGEPTVTRDATIALLASSDIAISKRGAASTQPDQNYSYTMDVGLTYPDLGNGNHGALSFTNVVLSDPLPAEAVYVSSNYGGVYDAGTHTVTWQFGALRSGVNNVLVTVKYPVPAGGGAATYVNTATVTGTQIGSLDPKSASDDSPVIVRVDAPSYRTDASKEGTPLIADGVQHFDILATNRGNTNADISVTDPIPDGLNVTSVDAGYYRGNAKPGSTLELHYADNTSSGPLPFDVPNVVVPAGSPRVTSITVVFKQVDVGASVSVAIYSVGDWAVIGDATSITNCATIATTGADDAQKKCATIEVSPVDVPNPNIQKSAGQAPVGPGGTNTWTIGISNGNTTPLMPVIYDYTPNEVTYVAGSLRAAPGNSAYCLPATDFAEEVLPDWNQTHGTPFTAGPRTTVRWTYTGTAGLLIPKYGVDCNYQYDTIVNPGVNSGVYGGSSFEPAYRGNLVQIFDRDVRVPSSQYGWVNDIFDGDGDGDTTEMAPRRGADFAVADSSAAWIEKKVTGDRDNGHWFDSAEKKAKHDEVGTSTPGGTVSYQVRLGNMGNRSLTKLVAYDLLPQPGNHGVTNGRYAQNPPGAGNTWTPMLTGPIANPNPGSLNITYSVKADPCRPEMDNSDEHSASFYCKGQQDSSWQTAEQVGDWSQIRSVRFDFGNKIFAGGEFVDLEWTMATPTTLADGSPILGGERTWNRIALDAVQAVDGVPLLAAEAPWVVDQMAVPTVPPVRSVPAISIEKWSTEDGFPAGDFDSAPGKTVKANSPTAITMTITNEGAEALKNVKVTDDTLNGPAMTDLSCDFSPLGGPASGTSWEGPVELGASFECTGLVPALQAAAVHADKATVTAVGVTSGTAVQDADEWHATTPSGATPLPLDPPSALATTGIGLGVAGLAAAGIVLGLALSRSRRRRLKA